MAASSYNHHDDLTELLAGMAEIEHRRRINRIELFYPETGLLRRELYPKHMLAFALGNHHTVRVVRSANRVGKTEGIGGYETALHLTGEYPDWWPGKRFSRPITAVAAGTTIKSTRKILQKKLLGDIGSGKLGTGMIPKRCLGQPRMVSGGNGAVDYIPVRHASGLWSQLSFASYEQGREAFEGFEADLAWLDEEPPLPIYSEVVLRTMDTSGTDDEAGIVLVTFTPMQGTTEMVKAVDAMSKRGRMQGAQDTNAPVRIVITWDDVPHLTDKAKRDMLANTPEHEHEARATGAPMLGSGAIYTTPLNDLLIKSFAIPPHWKKVYGLDVGWKCTACIWGALDPDSDILYLYSEHYLGHAEPYRHAAAIKARGEWIPGIIDKAARSSSQKDGSDLYKTYRGLGLRVKASDVKNQEEHLRENGLMAVSTRMATGRLRVFEQLINWRDEYSSYHRKDGKIPDGQDDHAMDATRMLVVWGLPIAKVYAPTRAPSPGADMTFGLYQQQ